MTAPRLLGAQQPPVPARALSVLDEIPTVFGASRFDQLSTEAPASVTIITRDDIDAHGWRTLGDVLQTVRGFYSTYDGLYTSVGARGFSRPGDYNTRLLLLLDGHPVNEKIYDSAPLGFDQLLDLRNVDRIEVIRGPSSSLYGTNALFGVINVVLRNGRSIGGVEATGVVESFGTREAALLAGNRYANGLDLSLNMVARRSDGRDFYTPEFVAGPTGGWARDLDGERRTLASARASWGSFSATVAYVSREKELATARYVVDYGQPGSSFDDRRGMLGLTFDRAFTSTDVARVNASLQDYRYDGAYVYSGEHTNDWSHARWATVDGQYSIGRLAHHRLVVGTTFLKNVRQEQGYRYGADTTFLDNAQEYALAAYAQDEMRLGTSWIVNGGVRLDYYSTFGSVVNPRVGLIRTFRTGSVIKALYGTAFRAPSIFERRYEGADVLPNFFLQPERLQTAELLAEHRLAANVKITAALFRNDMHRLIDYQALEDDSSVVQYRNTGSARASGGEIEVEYELHGGRARASYVYARSVEARSGSPLANAPRHLGAFDVVVPLTRRAIASLELRTMSQRQSSSGEKVAGYLVANAWLSTALPVARVRLTAGVDNLFDAGYDDPTGDDFVQSRVPQARRTLRVGLRVGGR